MRMRTLLAICLGFCGVLLVRLAAAGSTSSDPLEHGPIDGRATEREPSALGEPQPNGPSPDVSACPPDKVELREVEPWIQRRSRAQSRLDELTTLRRSLEGEAEVASGGHLTEEDIEPGLLRVAADVAGPGMKLRVTDCSEHPCMAVFHWQPEEGDPAISIPDMISAFGQLEEWEGLAVGAIHKPMGEDRAAVLFTVFEEHLGQGDLNRILSRFESIVNEFGEDAAP